MAAGKKKNAADEKLRQSMRRFVDAHGHREDQDVALVLISGDQDFLPDLSDFRHRQGIVVVLLHNRLAPDHFRRAADVAMDFHELVRDVPVRATSQGPVQYTELRVSNVPSQGELTGPSSVANKLEEMTRPW